MKNIAKLVAVLLCICMLFTSCTPAGQSVDSSENTVNSQKVENLEKLCLVWGYSKYRHPAFYTGEKDWDEELLALIPQVQEAKTDKETNQILYDWFESLGQADFGETRNHQSWKNQDPDKIDIQADISWSKDNNYLGEKLSAALQQIEILPTVKGESTPPVKNNGSNGMLQFNEKNYPDFDYGDLIDRLLGLFRVWNAVEYYFPYLDLMDENWHDLLPEYISQMLNANDRHSYDLILASMTAKLRDPHVSFTDTESITEELGEYLIPVNLMMIEGYPVVVDIFSEDCQLQIGDSIRKLNGQEIWEVIKGRQKYISTSTDEKVRSMVLNDYLLTSHEQMMEITVLRDGKEQTFEVKGYTRQEVYEQIREIASKKKIITSKILEENIGYIQMGTLTEENINETMDKMAETDGLILDLRVYPHYNAALLMQRYLSKGVGKVPMQWGDPMTYYPGAYLYRDQTMGMNTISEHKGEYSEKPVVVIIDEGTWSFGEYIAMIYQTNENVILLGENTIGSDGDRKTILLPDQTSQGEKREFGFTCFGVYGPNMEQVQRIGLTPDIEVHPTIEGIKEGKDELKEAAVAYIQEQNAK